MLQDVRYALRLMLQSKGFAAVAILTLALGIGATTAAFSIVNGALLRPLPYRHPERLTEILDQSLHERGFNKLFPTYTDFRTYSQHAQSFEGIAAITWAVKNPILTGHGEARNVTAMPVSAGFFDLLGVRAQIGRTFAAADESRGCSVVLASAFWTSAFDGDPRIVGKTLALDDKPCTVIGVMPASFAFYPAAAQMWPLITSDRPGLDKLLAVSVGRLKPGVSLAAAHAELSALHASLHAGDAERDFGPAVDPMQEELTWLAGRNLRTTLWVLLGAVGLVLMIACVNVANLLLGRSIARSREFAVRAALGGGRMRLFRQLLTEGLLLSAMGGALGVWLAFEAVRYFRAVNPVELPVGAEITIDARVLLFTLLVSVLTALVFGAAPAWRASRADLNAALKSGGRGNVRGVSRLGRGMVAVEMALSVALLAGAGLLMQSVLRMGSADLGIQPEGLARTRITLPEGRYADAAARWRFYQSLEQKVAALPGLQAAALTSSLPPEGTGTDTLEVFGQPKPAGNLPHNTTLQWIGGDYLPTMGTPLISGRALDEHDDGANETVALIDETLARDYFPNGDAIGKRIRVGGERNPWLTIVGIAGAERRSTVYREMDWVTNPTVFRPMAQEPPQALSLAVRTRDPGLAVGMAIQREAATIDSGVAVGATDTMRQVLRTYLRYPQFRATVFGGFAAFALLLAAIGLHGVLSELVSQRTAEFGVRMALGARPADIARLIAQQAAGPVMLGLAAGIVAILALGRYLASLLYGVRAQDGATLTLAGLVLIAAAAFALARPARRAASTDPMEALRQE